MTLKTLEAAVMKDPSECASCLINNSNLGLAQLCKPCPRGIYFKEAEE